MERKDNLIQLFDDDLEERLQRITAKHGVELDPLPRQPDRRAESANLSANLEAENWISVSNASELLGVSRQAVQKACKQRKYTTRTVKGRGGTAYEILRSSLPHKNNLDNAATGRGLDNAATGRGLDNAATGQNDDNTSDEGIWCTVKEYSNVCGIPERTIRRHIAKKDFDLPIRRRQHRGASAYEIYTTAPKFIEDIKDMRAKRKEECENKPVEMELDLYGMDTMALECIDDWTLEAHLNESLSHTSDVQLYSMVRKKRKRVKIKHPLHERLKGIAAKAGVPVKDIYREVTRRNLPKLVEISKKLKR